jgi:hypothetical protein
MYSPEVQEQIRALRAKPTKTLDDYREAVRLLREGRESAAAGAAKKASGKRSSTPVDVDKLFNDLDAL